MIKTKHKKKGVWPPFCKGDTHLYALSVGGPYQLKLLPIFQGSFEWHHLFAHATLVG